MLAEINGVSSRSSKIYAVCRLKKMGPTDRLRSRCSLFIFHFCKVPRALLGKSMALQEKFDWAFWLLRAFVLFLQRSYRGTKNRPKWPSTTSVRLLHMSGWVAGHSGMLRGQSLASSACSGPVIIVHQGLLRRPVATVSVSATVSMDNQMFRDGSIVASLCSYFFLLASPLWRTRENKHDKITAHGIKWPGEKWRNVGPWEAAIKWETPLITIWNLLSWSFVYVC